jgi:hypothetical protein
MAGGAGPFGRLSSTIETRPAARALDCRCRRVRAARAAASARAADEARGRSRVISFELAGTPVNPNRILGVGRRRPGGCKAVADLGLPVSRHLRVATRPRLHRRGRHIWSAEQTCACLGQSAARLGAARRRDLRLHREHGAAADPFRPRRSPFGARAQGGAGQVRIAVHRLGIRPA